MHTNVNAQMLILIKLQLMDAPQVIWFIYLYATKFEIHV